MPVHLLDTPSEKLGDWLKLEGQPGFRAHQIQDWLYAGRAACFEDMTNLPKRLRVTLARDWELWTTQVVTSHEASDGTEKLLLELADGHRVECVLLRDGERRTICISTQVGCAMGCVFCASGIGGVIRNLSTGEIIEQMLRLQRLLPADERLSHIVVMGMGEPLANLDRLLPALDMASHPRGLGISARRITISTVGLPPAIDRLVERGSRYHLAVSLHAPTDALRDTLVPVNASVGMEAILSAADRYFEASGRRLTYEYVLLANVNDQVDHAHALAQVLRGRPALLNIIPYNPVAGLPYGTPSTAALHAFREVLEGVGIQVMVRQRKGDQINAACGQLRREHGPQVVPLTPPSSAGD